MHVYVSQFNKYWVFHQLDKDCFLLLFPFPPKLNKQTKPKKHPSAYTDYSPNLLIFLLQYISIILPYNFYHLWFIVF